MKLLQKLLCVLFVFVLAATLTACGLTSERNGGELSKQLQFICPQSAGGETDVNMRLLAGYLEEELGVTIVCENVTGGNGSVAMSQYKDMQPDGTTFIYTNSAAVSGNFATGLVDFGYEAFDPVAICGISSGEVILVPADSPYQTLEELVEATKANPGEIVYGGPTGGASYLACYLALNKEYGAGFVCQGDGFLDTFLLCC